MEICIYPSLSSRDETSSDRLPPVSLPDWPEPDEWAEALDRLFILEEPVEEREPGES